MSITARGFLNPSSVFLKSHLSLEGHPAGPVAGACHLVSGREWEPPAGCGACLPTKGTSPPDAALGRQALPSVIAPTFASSSASDNIPKADEIRTLIKDVWDTRIAKLRVSADSFVRQQEAHAKVGGRRGRGCRGTLPTAGAQGTWCCLPVPRSCLPALPAVLSDFKVW